jgi:hypothetical protein
VPEHVRRHALAKPRLLGRRVQVKPHRRRRYWAIFLLSGEQPGPLRPLREPVAAKHEEHPLRQKDVSIASAFAEDADGHALAVDVRDLQAADLADAQPRAVGRHHDGAVLGGVDRIKKLPDLASAQDLRHVVRDLRPRDGRDHLRPAKHDLVEELDPRDVHLARGGSGLLLLDEVHQELADLQLPHLLRRSAVIRYERLRAGHVLLASPPGVIAKLKVLDHLGHAAFPWQSPWLPRHCRDGAQPGSPTPVWSA